MPGFVFGRGVIRSAALVLFIVVLVVPATNGAVRNAASCSTGDVQSAINAASAGDTVIVPAGRCIWRTFITVGNITLQGAGATDSGTVITVDGINNVVRHPKRITGFKFIIQNAEEIINTAVTDMRIDHNVFENQSGGPKTTIMIASASPKPHPSGVIDHNTFINGRILILPDLNGGNALWHEPSKIGKADGVIYIEDNMFEDASGETKNAVDTNSGGRYVFRHNRVVNSLVEAHSLQGGGESRATRSWEVYENDFTTTRPMFTPMFLRAGTGVAFNNRISGPYSFGAIIDNIRSYDTVYGAPPCDGRDSRDGNQIGGWPCRDQIGRSTDTAGKFPQNQSSEPAYFWNNSLNGNPVSPAVTNCVDTVKQRGSCADILNGRDYITNTPRPGYVPFAYPHPLVSKGSTGSSASIDPTGVRLLASRNVSDKAVSGQRWEVR